MVVGVFRYTMAVVLAKKASFYDIQKNSVSVVSLL